MVEKFGGLGIGRMPPLQSRISMYKESAPLIMLFCWSLLLLAANAQTPKTHPQEGIFFCFFISISSLCSSSYEWYINVELTCLTNMQFQHCGTSRNFWLIQTGISAIGIVATPAHLIGLEFYALTKQWTITICMSGSCMLLILT